MAPRLTVAEVVEMGDLDELLRRIDELCDAADWAGLLDLRRRCRSAFELAGRQLWPAASHAEYRLALEAPGRWAAAVVEPGAGRFALGPLSEVVASSHSWAELAAHLPPTPEAALVAGERVVRGDDLRGVDLPIAAELPLVLQDWEPSYPGTVYRPYKAEFASVDAPAMEAVAVHAAPEVDDRESTDALLELVTPWTTQSNGEARVAAVTGDAPAAIGALGVGPEARLVAVDASHALALMAWTAASGGAHGRRRGMANGRFSAWWTAAALAGGGALDGWPDLEPHLGEVRWYRWDRIGPTTGWALRLAAERRRDGRAFAIEATDARRP